MAAVKYTTITETAVDKYSCFTLYEIDVFVLHIVGIALIV